MKLGTKITLGIKRTVSRAQDSRESIKKAQLAFSKIKPAILERDNHTCAHCDDRFLKYQEVHHIDDDHTNNKDSNCACVCVLCHLSHHIGFASLKSDHKLIYCPELEQGELNSMIRSLWVAREIGEEQFKVKSESFLANFDSRSSYAESILGTSDPAVLARHLASLNAAQYNERESYLKDIRILYSSLPFKAQLSHWSDSVKRSTPSDTWLKLGALS